MQALGELPRLGSGIGLHRVLWLRERIGAEAYFLGTDAVKVTGSNGKGSVAAMVAAIFRRLGLSCGLYTSPHLRSFAERIRVDGEPISDADLAVSAEWTRSRIEEYAAAHPGDEVGAFEAMTVLALHHFARRRPKVLVVEAGIGGRYDPARVVPGRYAALTSIDREHTELLGETPELIAYDKADLCPDGGVLVVGSLEDELLRRLREYARLRGLELLSVADRCRLSAPRYEGEGMVVDLDVEGESWHGLEVALAGRHQAANAALAILLARAWTRKHLPDLASDALRRAVRAGLREVEWPGRFEKVASDPDVFVDVGHSPRAVETVAETCRERLAGRRILLVVGASEDKLVEEIVARLAAVADAVVATRAWHRGSAVERIERAVRAARPEVPMTSAADVEAAVAVARERARTEDMTVLVAGGLFLAVEASEVLAGRDPRALRFF